MQENIEIKLFTIERRRNYLVSEPNYDTTKFFKQHLLALEMKKTLLWKKNKKQNKTKQKKAEILPNKPVYLGFSILELSKILMYEFWYD